MKKILALAAVVALNWVESHFWLILVVLDAIAFGIIIAVLLS